MACHFRNLLPTELGAWPPAGPVTPLTAELEIQPLALYALKRGI